MEPTSPTRTQTKSRLAMILGLLTALLGVMAAAWLLIRRFGRPAEADRWRGFKPQVSGLSEAEAASRQDGSRLQERQRLESEKKKETWRTSIFSIFNLTMLVLAVSQFILQDPWGSLGTLGVLAFNIVLTVVQREFAARQVSKFSQQTGQFATVIRSGRLRSLNLDELVAGDVLVAGPGDEILADGRLLSGENLQVSEANSPEEKIPVMTGETLAMGSVCQAGEAVYEIFSPPPLLPEQSDKNGKSAKKSRSPLEILIDRVLITMLVFTGIFYMATVLQLLKVPVVTDEIMLAYRDLLSTIFSLVPAGFFLMVIVNYAMGSIDLARKGALVRDQRSVETLAQMNTLCFIRENGLLAMDVRLEMIPAQSDAPALPENQVQHLLGDIGRSVAGGGVSSNKIYLDALAEFFAGEAIPVNDECFYLSLLGWGALAFDTPERRGVYVIGYPDALEPQLVKQEKQTQEDASEPRKPRKLPPAIVKVTSRLGGWLNRQAGRLKSTLPNKNTAQSPALPVEAGDPEVLDPPAAQPIAAKPSFKLRLVSSLASLSKRLEKIQGIPEAVTGSQANLLTLVFAYKPDLVPLFDPDGYPVCPDELIPICRLYFSEQVVPAMRNVLQRFELEGVRPKVFSSLTLERSLQTRRELGWGLESEEDSILSAQKFTQLDPTDRLAAIQKATSLNGFSVAQEAEVIAGLRQNGEVVGVVGESIRHWKSMRLGNLSMALKGSDQALINRADIILVEKSLAVLNPLLERGQQIVHGTLDVIRLNLVQIFYTLLLLILAFLFNHGVFLYNASQGGMIAFFTVTLPSAVLSFWALKGRVNQGYLHQNLARFIFPPVLIIAALTWTLFQFSMGRGDDLEYTRHVVTHALVGMGTLVAVFARPPVTWLVDGTRSTARSTQKPGMFDLRPFFADILFFVVFQIMVWIPLAQKYLYVAPLDSWGDYAMVFLLSLFAGVLIQLVWRIVNRLFK